MDVSQPLKGSRIDDAPLIAVERDEDVNRIAKFVVVLQGAIFPGFSLAIPAPGKYGPRRQTTANLQSKNRTK